MCPSSVFWVTALFISGLQQQPMVSADPITNGKNISSQGNITRTVSDSESEATRELISNLIGALEKLDILTTKSSSCHTLDKIVRQVKSLDQTQDSREIRVVLYFRENSLNHSSQGKIRQTKDLNSLSECRNVLLSDAHSLLKNRDNSNNSSMINTTVGSGAQSEQKEEEDQYQGFLGLSRTQVVVISTCSAIIGTFFFVAAIMRIRNYVKRIQAEQQLQRRQTFRSCSFTLANNNSPSRDSSHSKTSPKGSYTVRMPKVNSSGKISSNGSRTLPDTKPLLTVNPITTTTTLPSKLSNQSLDYIDEDPKIMEPSVETIKEIVKDEPKPADNQPLIERESSLKNNPNKGIKLETTRGWTFDQEVTEAGKQGLLRANSSFDHIDKRYGLLRGNSSADRPTGLVRAISGFDKDDGVCDTVIPLTRSGDGTLQNNVKQFPLSGVSPIVEELPTPETVEYSNFGLTQSDESLSTSGSSPYSYGNQSEYKNGYMFCIPARNIMVNNQTPSPSQDNLKEVVSKCPNTVVTQDSVGSGVINNDKHSNEKTDVILIPSNDSMETDTGTNLGPSSVEREPLPNTASGQFDNISPHPKGTCESSPLNQENKSPQTQKQKPSLQRLVSVDDERTTFL
ncbi:hypothetical protein SNE40_015632 [Patella caerulea]|uniref:Uncharacterized protein n=1 Tax=Patella caerulea TaxID=87958 RepID=A0AAN8PSA8_PATCE